MLGNKHKKKLRRLLFNFFLIVFAVLFLKEVIAANLTNGSVLLSDPRPSTSSSYTFTMSGASSTTVRCVKIELATTVSGSVVPAGLGSSAAGVAINASSNFVTGISSWSLDKTTNGTIKISNATGGTPTGTNGTIIIDGITNGSTANTAYYARFNTFSDQTCTTAVDTNTITFIYTNGQILSLTVDPNFTFTVNNVETSQTVNGATTTAASSTNSIPMGTVTVGSNAIAAQDLTVETNAGHGYSIYTRYTAAPTNGSHNIADFSGTNVAPTTFSAAGTEAFGYTTSSTTLSTDASRFSGGKWAKFTTTNAEIGHSENPTTSAETTRIGYQAGISGSTPAGTYTTTIVLTATPTY